MTDPLVQSTGDLASGATQPLVDSATAATQPLVDSATAGTQPLVEGVSGVTDPLVQSTGDLASGATQPLVESATAGTQPLVEGVSGVTDPLVQSTGDLASGATQPLVESATAATQPLVEGAAGVTDPLVQSTGDLASGATQPLVESATAGTQPLVEGVSGVTDPLVQSTGDLASGATQPLVDERDSCDAAAGRGRVRGDRSAGAVDRGHTRQRDSCDAAAGRGRAGVTDPLVQSTGDLASGATQPLVEGAAGVTDPLVHATLTAAVAGAPDPALTSAGPDVATAWPMLPVAQPAKATSPSVVDGGFAGELPTDLAAVGAAVGSFEGRMLLTGAVMLAVTARVAGSDWGLTPMLNTCGMSVRMSFGAMRLIPCRSAQALRSVASPAFRGFSLGKGEDTGSALATTRPSADGHRGGALRVPHAPSWPIPLAGTALVRMFAVIVAAASAVISLVCGAKDEVEQRRRHEYRGRLHS